MFMFLELNRDIVALAKIYNIPFDLSEAKQLVKKSKRKILEWKGILGYSLIPIIKKYHSKGYSIIVLGNGKCLLSGKYLCSDWNFFSLISKALNKENVDGCYLVVFGNRPKAVLKAKESDVLSLMDDLYNLKHTSSFLTRSFKFFDYYISKEKLRNFLSSFTFENRILIPLRPQRRGLEKLKDYRKITIHYTSTSTLKIKVRNYYNANISFEIPIRSLNPSSSLKGAKSEETKDYWFSLLFLDREPLSKIFSQLLSTKNSFEFSINGEALKVRKVRAKYYLENFRVTKDRLIYYLLKLKEKTREEIINELASIKKTSEKAKLLIENGINGFFIDVDGKVLCSIKVSKRDRNYYLRIGNKEFKARGGLKFIIKLRNQLHGVAKSKGISCRNYLEILRTLKNLFGEEKAILFYKTIKSENRKREQKANEEIKMLLRKFRIKLRAEKGRKNTFLIKIKGKSYLLEYATLYRLPEFEKITAVSPAKEEKLTYTECVLECIKALIGEMNGNQTKLDKRM